MHKFLQDQIIASDIDITNLARKAKVSRQVIHKLMNGGDILLSTAEKLATSLGMEVRYVVRQ